MAWFFCVFFFWQILFSAIDVQLQVHLSGLSTIIMMQLIRIPKHVKLLFSYPPPLQCLIKYTIWECVTTMLGAYICCQSICSCSHTDYFSRQVNFSDKFFIHSEHCITPNSCSSACFTKKIDTPLVLECIHHCICSMKGREI